MAIAPHILTGLKRYSEYTLSEIYIHTLARMQLPDKPAFLDPLHYVLNDYR